MGYFSFMQQAIITFREEIKKGRKYTKEEIKACEEDFLKKAVYVGTYLVFECNGRKSSTFAEALSPFKETPLESLNEFKTALEGVLLCRGVLEKGKVPMTPEESMALVSSMAKELIPSMAFQFDKQRLIASGQLQDLGILFLSLKGSGLNTRGYTLIREEIESESGELVPYLSIEKETKNVYAKLTIQEDLKPTNKNAEIVFIYVCQKIAEVTFIKGRRNGGEIKLNINDLIGEGKPFPRKDYALEPFLQIKTFLQNLKYTARYRVKSEGYRRLSMSLFGRVDERKGDAIEELTIFTGFVAYEDGTCVFHINERIKDISAIFHKVASVPVFGDKWKSEEQALFILIYYWYTSGKSRGGLRVLPNDRLLDFLGIGQIDAKTRNKHTLLKKALRTLEAVKAKDSGEYFQTFDVSMNETAKTAYGKLKSLTVSVEMKGDKILGYKGGNFNENE